MCTEERVRTAGASALCGPVPLTSTTVIVGPMTHRKLQPSGDHILIQFADAARAQAVASGRRKRKKNASPAKVIAVGPGHTGADGNRIPLGLKVGEKILVDQACGVRIKLNRQSYAVIRKRDLVEASG